MFLCLSDVWKTQFDPQVTSKGVFYLDNQKSVSVDMMKSAQYPLRMMGDPDLQAQVTPTFTGSPPNNQSRSPKTSNAEVVTFYCFTSLDPLKRIEKLSDPIKSLCSLKFYFINILSPENIF